MMPFKSNFKLSLRRSGKAQPTQPSDTMSAPANPIPDNTNRPKKREIISKVVSKLAHPRRSKQTKTYKKTTSDEPVLAPKVSRASRAPRWTDVNLAIVDSSAPSTSVSLVSTAPESPDSANSVQAADTPESPITPVSADNVDEQAKDEQQLAEATPDLAVDEQQPAEVSCELAVDDQEEAGSAEAAGPVEIQDSDEQLLEVTVALALEKQKNKTLKAHVRTLERKILDKEIEVNDLALEHGQEKQALKKELDVAMNDRDLLREGREYAFNEWRKSRKEAVDAEEELDQLQTAFDEALQEKDETKKNFSKLQDIQIKLRTAHKELQATHEATVSELSRTEADHTATKLKLRDKIKEGYRLDEKYNKLQTSTNAEIDLLKRTGLESSKRLANEQANHRQTKRQSDDAKLRTFEEIKRLTNEIKSRDDKISGLEGSVLQLDGRIKAQKESHDGQKDVWQDQVNEVTRRLTAAIAAANTQANEQRMLAEQMAAEWRSLLERLDRTYPVGNFKLAATLTLVFAREREKFLLRRITSAEADAGTWVARTEALLDKERASRRVGDRLRKTAQADR